jgi:uncharacterized protein (TIGR03382 family)
VNPGGTPTLPGGKELPPIMPGPTPSASPSEPTKPTPGAEPMLALAVLWVAHLARRRG